jgi:hypothetical protein
VFFLSRNKNRIPSPSQKARGKNQQTKTGKVKKDTALLLKSQALFA